MPSASSSPATSHPSSPVLRARQGMEQHGQHLFSLPSSPRFSLHNTAGSSAMGSAGTTEYSGSTTLASSRSSSVSSIDLGAAGLTRAGQQLRGGTFSSARSPPVSAPPPPAAAAAAASRSPMASTSFDARAWSLLSIDRLRQPSGMVLVALFHVPTQTLYTWPLQTDPSASQPKQGTVFINRRPNIQGDSPSASPLSQQKSVIAAEVDADATSESLRVLRAILVTWMTSQKARGKARTRLGESIGDASDLTRSLGLLHIDVAEAASILKIQSVRPAEEWSSTEDAAASGQHGAKESKEAFCGANAPSVVALGMPSTPAMMSSWGKKSTSSSVSPPGSTLSTTSLPEMPRHSSSSPLSSPPFVPATPQTPPESRRRGKPILRILQTITNSSPSLSGKSTPVASESPLHGPTFPRSSRDGARSVGSSPPRPATQSILKSNASPSKAGSSLFGSDASASSLRNVPSIEISSPHTTDQRMVWPINRNGQASTVMGTLAAMQ